MSEFLTEELGTLPSRNELEGFYQDVDDLRLQADRFYTDSYNEETYTPEGLEWIDRASLKSVLLRHYPELAQTGLANVKNAFEPWDTDPFKFTKKGDRYFGRGTTDDKGPALSALWGFRAARDAGVPVNLNVIWELEEEIGSPNFESTIRKHWKELATDHVIVSDTIWVAAGRPALVVPPVAASLTPQRRSRRIHRPSAASAGNRSTTARSVAAMSEGLPESATQRKGPFPSQKSGRMYAGVNPG